MKKFLSVILIILSAVSLIAGFVTVVAVSGRYPASSSAEALYHTARFSWIVFVFMLIPLGCLVFGIGCRQKKNLVVGIVFSALFLIYGGLLSAALIQFSMDPAYLDELEAELDIGLPDGMTVVTQDWTGGTQTSSDDYWLRYDSVARFQSPSDADAFIQGMDAEKWLTVKDSLAGSIPTVTGILTDNCEYFLLYCYETHAWNEAVSVGPYRYVYMALDTEEGVLFITEFTRK